jgi:hypothetical protein
VETQEFRNILLGYKVIVYTDHKNLCCKTLNTERSHAMVLILERASTYRDVVADVQRRPFLFLHSRSHAMAVVKNDGLEAVATTHSHMSKSHYVDKC